MSRLVTRHRCNDGREFDTAEEAAAYEAEHPEVVLIGLILEDIEDALVGKAPDVADALEKLGARCAESRRAAGNFKRARKGSSDELPPAVSVYERGRGARDFHAGIGGIVPDDLRGTPAAELWLVDWDAASVEAKQRSDAA